METGRQDGGSDKNHAPFSVGKTGNISRKFLTIILKIFDKNFERLQFSLKEISEALDIPEGTIKSRLSRAREFLKVQLSEEEKRPATGKNSKQLKRITGKGKMSC